MAEVDMTDTCMESVVDTCIDSAEAVAELLWLLEVVVAEEPGQLEAWL